MEDVRVLGRRVVAPDRHVGDVIDLRAGLLGELRDRAVVVEPHHRREALARDVGGVALRDQAVGVRGIADDEHLDVRRGVIVERLALRLEDAAVGLAAGRCAPSPSTRGRAPTSSAMLTPSNALFGIVVDVDSGEQRERAVVELHRRALGGLDRRGDLQQRQLDGGVRAEQLPARDAEQDRVADLAGGSSHRHSYRGLAHWVHLQGGSLNESFRCYTAPARPLGPRRARSGHPVHLGELALQVGDERLHGDRAADDSLQQAPGWGTWPHVDGRARAATPAAATARRRRSASSRSGMSALTRAPTAGRRSGCRARRSGSSRSARPTSARPAARRRRRRGRRVRGTRLKREFQTSGRSATASLPSISSCSSSNRSTMCRP